MQKFITKLLHWKTPVLNEGDCFDLMKEGEEALTLQSIMTQNGQAHFKNIAIFTVRPF